MNNKIIEYNLDFYIIDQDLYEPDQLFYERVWYILSNYNKPNNQKNLMNQKKSGFPAW